MNPSGRPSQLVFSLLHSSFSEPQNFVSLRSNLFDFPRGRNSRRTNRKIQITPSLANNYPLLLLIAALFGTILLLYVCGSGCVRGCRTRWAEHFGAFLHSSTSRFLSSFRLSAQLFELWLTNCYCSRNKNWLVCFFPLFSLFIFLLFLIFCLLLIV